MVGASDAGLTAWSAAQSKLAYLMLVHAIAMYNVYVRATLAVRAAESDQHGIASSSSRQSTNLPIVDSLPRANSRVVQHGPCAHCVATLLNQLVWIFMTIFELVELHFRT